MILQSGWTPHLFHILCPALFDNDLNDLCFQQGIDESFDSTSTISVDEARVDMSGELVFQWFRDIFTGSAPVVSRQANILHVLGSVTVSCASVLALYESNIMVKGVAVEYFDNA